MQIRSRKGIEPGGYAANTKSFIQQPLNTLHEFHSKWDIINYTPLYVDVQHQSLDTDSPSSSTSKAQQKRSLSINRTPFPSGAHWTSRTWNDSWKASIVIRRIDSTRAYSQEFQYTRRFPRHLFQCRQNHFSRMTPIHYSMYTKLRSRNKVPVYPDALGSIVLVKPASDAVIHFLTWAKTALMGKGMSKWTLRSDKFLGMNNEDKMMRQSGCKANACRDRTKAG